MHDWDQKKTAETRRIEQRLRKEFGVVDAYRYNSASIRVRVIDDEFEGKSIPEREAMVELALADFPSKTRRDILLLLTIAPSELGQVNSQALINLEFEKPAHSNL